MTLNRETRLRNGNLLASRKRGILDEGISLREQSLAQKLSIGDV